MHLRQAFARMNVRLAVFRVYATRIHIVRQVSCGKLCAQHRGKMRVTGKRILLPQLEITSEKEYYSITCILWPANT